MPWYTGPDAAGASGDGRRRRRAPTRSRSAFRCSGSTARTSISAASPAPSPAARCAGRRRRGAASGQHLHRRAHRHRRWRPRPRGGRRRGDAVLADEVDVLARRRAGGSQARPSRVDQFAAKLVWMDEEPLLPGRSYLLKIGTAHRAGHGDERSSTRIDVQHARRTSPAADAGAERDRAVSRSRPRRADRLRPLCENRETGAFILIDRLSNATVAAGMISLGLDAARQRPLAGHDRRQAARAPRLKGQKPLVLWFTGLSGSGKSTIANLVEQRLHRARPPYHAARRRQCAPWPQPRPRLRRPGPRRECPPRVGRGRPS